MKSCPKMARLSTPRNANQKLTLTLTPWHGFRIVKARTGRLAPNVSKRHKSGVPAASRTSGDNDMRHKNSFELFAYWTEKRGKRAAPSRTDIEPADIRTLLPHVFICDLNDDGQLHFRLAGTALCALHDRELKGTAFSSLWLTDGARNADRTGASVAAGATPAVLSLDCLSSGGRVAQAELLLLPITGPSGRNDRLIGMLSVFDPPTGPGMNLLSDCPRPVYGFSIRPVIRCFWQTARRSR